MRFLYTGSKAYLAEQFNPEKSLGGFCSNSSMPNRKNNLFSDVSYFSKLNETEECRAIVIENNSETNYAEIGLGYVFDAVLYDMQIAIVELNSENAMEAITNSKNLPYYASFVDASITEAEDKSITLECPAGKKFGIWVKRKILNITPEENHVSVDFKFIVTD